jgi:Fibronectin type III-like domain
MAPTVRWPSSSDQDIISDSTRSRATTSFTNLVGIALGQPQDIFTEELYIDYRYLYSWLNEGEAKDAVKVANTSMYAYPRGYSSTQQPGPRAGGDQGGNPALWDIAYTISVTVTNVESTYPGKAVAQAYVQFPDPIPYDTPIIQLRDFAKTAALAPGESRY